MINAAFNVGAIAGANAARKSSSNSIYFGDYTREYKPKVMGSISIESDPLMSVRPSMIVDGIEIRFMDVVAVNKLIDKLTRLRDDMVKKETGVKCNIDIPVGARYIIRILENEHYDAYMSGGCDICTTAKPGEILALMSDHGVKTIITGPGTITAVIGDEKYEIRYLKETSND